MSSLCPKWISVRYKLKITIWITG